MSKSNLTLLVDGNWLLMSRLVVIMNNYDNDKDLCNNLQLLIIKSLKITLKQFPQIDNIIFCADGGSWRNNIDIPKYLVDKDGNPITYKGNREKDEEINWDAIFMAFEELISLLQQNGINAFKEHGLEGDDLIWWWSTYLNSQGTNCIIWSKDNDLKQLVNIDSNKCFTVWWNKTNGIYTPEFADDNLDFLFNIEYNNNDYLFRQLTKNEYQQINKNEIILDKIVRGDLGDNILPITYKISKTSEKLFRISHKDLDFSINWQDDNSVYNFLLQLYESKKYKDKLSCTLSEAFDHFKYNRQLVALDKKYYPKDIIDICENLELDYMSNNIMIVEEILNANVNKLNGILNII